jgi:hypothetical protein
MVNEWMKGDKSTMYKPKTFIKRFLYDFMYSYLKEYVIDGVSNEEEQIANVFQTFYDYIGSIKINSTRNPYTKKSYMRLFDFVGITEEEFKKFINILDKNPSQGIMMTSYSDKFMNSSTKKMMFGSKFSQSGGSEDFCSTLLTAFMLEANIIEGFDYETVMKKIRALVERLGQTSLVLAALRELVDTCVKEVVPEKGYLYSPCLIQNEEFARVLETEYNSSEFTEAEKRAFEMIAPKIVLHTKAPEEFQEIFGENGSYFLNKAGESEEDAPIQGIPGFEEDEVTVTPEESQLIEKDGVPLGFVLVLYLVTLCEKDINIGEIGDEDDS